MWSCDEDAQVEVVEAQVTPELGMHVAKFEDTIVADENQEGPDLRDVTTKSDHAHIHTLRSQVEIAKVVDHDPACFHACYHDQAHGIATGQKRVHG
ncbi:hypothetical protein LWI29_036879 [Acer saccharum]|uniref:Uncharacterized protein n=1 Tax=Acer saccharum TaxID=4024 RepID=A0AA39SIA4_ACESA|nr:hypothetical protein LWI29_036879 [Acer saccharum]